MQWDLGLLGLGLLLAMSLAFGLLAQVVIGRSTSPWGATVSAAAYFLGGLFVSEVWFGWATAQELQPNVDGLSFDEVLLICTAVGVAALLLVRHRARKALQARQTHARHHPRVGTHV